jgi:ribose 1,5-bisphosphate isomerase
LSAPVIHAVTKLWESVYTEFLSNPAICPLKGWVREKKNQIIRQMNKAVEDSAKHVAQLIPENSTLFFISYSNSVMAAIKYAVSKKIKVVVTESRPLCEGTRTADECAKLGIETTLITDAQMGIFIKDCSNVLVGADAVLSSGDVVNKAGTSIAAAIASAYRIPFYVIATTWKIYPEETIVLEKKSSAEILTGSYQFAIRNIYFDITPASNIASIIAEKGSLSPSQISSIAISIRKSFKSFLSNPLSA